MKTKGGKNKWIPQPLYTMGPGGIKQIRAYSKKPKEWTRERFILEAQLRGFPYEEAVWTWRVYKDGAI